MEKSWLADQVSSSGSVVIHFSEKMKLHNSPWMVDDVSLVFSSHREFPPIIGKPLPTIDQSENCGHQLTFFLAPDYDNARKECLCDTYVHSSVVLLVRVLLLHAHTVDTTYCTCLVTFCFG